jgi:hypothetical protein
VPLEETYRLAFESVPRRWLAILEPRKAHRLLPGRLSGLREALIVKLSLNNFRLIS